MLSPSAFTKVLALLCLVLMTACSSNPAEADPLELNTTLVTVANLTIVGDSDSERDPDKADLESPQASTLVTTTLKAPAVTNTTMPTTTTTVPITTTTIENRVIPAGPTTTYVIQTFEPSEQPVGLETVEPNS